MVGRLKQWNDISKIEEKRIQCVISKIKLKSDLTQSISVPLMQEILDGDQSMHLKLVYFFILLSCMLTFIYQVHDRVAFYLSYPVVVDVKSVIEEKMTLPQALVCSSDTMKMVELWEKYAINYNDYLANYNDFRCLNQFFALTNETRLNLETLYEATNTSKNFIQLYTKKANPTVDIKIKYETVNFQLGKCMLFTLDDLATDSLKGSKASIRLKKPKKNICTLAMIFVSLVRFKGQLNLKQTFTLPQGTNTKVWFSLTKFEFVNSKTKPCVDDNVFYNCVTKCLIKRLKKISFCRFPFTPSEINLPKCVTSNESRILYAEEFDMRENLDPIKHCNCPRQCSIVIYHQAAEAIEKKTRLNQTTETLDPCSNDSPDDCITELALEFKGNELVLFQQRLLYDSIALLSDIGGNLGLLLSLSVLSTIEILQTTWHLTTIANQTKHFQAFLGQKITLKKVFEINKKINIEKISIISYTSAIKIKEFLQISAYAMAIALSAWIVYDRTVYYWYEPLKTAIELSQPNTVVFPDFTLCGEHTSMQMKRFQLAKHLLKTTNISQDSCLFSPWNLIDTNTKKRMLVEKIWKKMSFWEDFQQDIDLASRVSGKPFPIHFEKYHVPLPYGNCTKFAVKGIVHYRGALTVHSIMLLRLREFNDIYCGKNYLKHLTTPPGEPVDLTTINSIPFNTKAILWLNVKKVIQLSTVKNPCTTTDIYLKCKTECFANKFAEQKINCSLPFMTNSSLPVCTTSADASQTNTAYLKIYLRSQPPEDCNCIRRCNETIYTLRIFTSPSMGTKITLINTLYYTNIIQTFLQIEAYPVSKFISDVGGCLGVFLGFSLPLLFDFFNKLKLKFSNIILNKNKSKQPF